MIISNVPKMEKGIHNRFSIIIQRKCAPNLLLYCRKNHMYFTMFVKKACNGLSRLNCFETLCTFSFLEGARKFGKFTRNKIIIWKINIKYFQIFFKQFCFLFLLLVNYPGSRLNSEAVTGNEYVICKSIFRI